jgi:hypothetical protein
MKSYGGMEIEPHTFLISALEGGRWLASCPVALFPEKKSRYYLKVGWVSPGAGLDAAEKRRISCLCRESNPGSSVVQPID